MSKLWARAHPRCSFLWQLWCARSSRRPSTRSSIPPTSRSSNARHKPRPTRACTDGQHAGATQSRVSTAAGGTHASYATRAATADAAV